LRCTDKERGGLTSGRGDMDVLDTEIERSTEPWQEG